MRRFPSARHLSREPSKRGRALERQDARGEIAGDGRRSIPAAHGALRAKDTTSAHRGRV